MADTGLMPAPDWNDGTGKKALTLPPDALVAAPLFQTTSLATLPLPSGGCSTVPPTPVAFGDEGGKLNVGQRPRDPAKSCRDRAYLATRRYIWPLLGQSSGSWPLAPIALISLGAVR
ncbi:MAG: hypothetical protein ABSB01_24695 [Streptosporangiaceae bacterium]